MRSYSNEAFVTFDGVNTAGVTTFSTAGTQTLPAKAVAAMGAQLSGQPTPTARVLQSAQIVAVTGLVATAGTGTISIGDGTLAARYGTISIASSGAGTVIQATMNLTEEGFRIGLNEPNLLTQSFVLTYAGSALVVNGLKIVVGYF